MDFPSSVLKQPSFFLLSDCPTDRNPGAEHVYVSGLPCITPSLVAQFLSGWMLVPTSIQLSKRMVFGLPAWIDEPRNMSKWIGTIWAAWHRVERGGNELPSIGGSLMSLKWLSSSFSLVFFPSLLTWASPRFLYSRKSIHLTLKENRQEVASGCFACLRTQADTLLWMLQVQVEVATQNGSQLVKSKARWHNCMCSCSLAHFCHSHLF